MYQQRSEPEWEVREGRGLWRPLPDGEDVQLVPEDGDQHGVVDDLEAERVVVVLDAWPNVDGAGNLVFSGDALTRDFPIAYFQGLVNRQRTHAGQPAADRALRVGDVFWIRTDPDVGLASPEEWRILDVTGPARRAARAAQLIAANPALRAPAVQAPRQAVEPSPEEQSQRPATGAASPAV